MTPLRRLRASAEELWGPLATVALTLAVLARLVGTPWAHYLFVDGDSLALPLLQRSVLSGEPFQWVMTSQIFLFPELPLYAISAVLGVSPQGALVVNAVLNILVFYALLRWIAARALPGRSRALQQLSGFVAIAGYLGLASTEGRALVNVGGFAPGGLLTTYYFGILLSGLFCLAVALDVTRANRAGAPRRRVAILLVSAALVSAVTTLSNPLFLLDAAAGFVLALVGAWVLRRMTLRWAAVLGATVSGSAVLGYVARAPFASLIATDAAGYLHADRAGVALSTLMAQIADVASTWAGRVEIVVVACLIAAAMIGILAAVHAQLRPETSWQAADPTVLILLVIVANCAVVLAAQILTGSLVSRYLLPLATYPVLALIPAVGSPVVAAAAARLRFIISVTWLSRLRVAGTVALTVGTALVVVLAAPAIASVASSSSHSADAGCLADWVGSRTVAGESPSGVGSFWSTRPLQLYGPEDLDVQQVNFDFTAQLWMNNLYDYEGKDFSFVLADHVPDWSALALSRLGEPASVTQCPSFDVYDYAGTPGHAELAAIVGTSIDTAKENRGF